MTEAFAIVDVMPSIASLVHISKSIIEVRSGHYKVARTAEKDILSISSNVNVLNILLQNLQKLSDKFSLELSNPAYSLFYFLSQ